MIFSSDKRYIIKTMSARDIGAFAPIVHQRLGPAMSEVHVKPRQVCEVASAIAWNQTSAPGFNIRMRAFLSQCKKHPCVVAKNIAQVCASSLVFIRSCGHAVLAFEVARDLGDKLGTPTTSKIMQVRP